MVMGPKTATRSTDETSTQPISPAGTEPSIRPRTTVARWLIGLTSTTACIHPGIVFGSTKMLLTNVSGNITIMLTPATEFGVRRIRLSIVHSHDKGSRVWLEEYGASAIGARLYAAMAGFQLEEGETAQTFEIAPAAARKLPKDMIGRVLEGAEVERLMKIIAKTAKKKP